MSVGHGGNNSRHTGLEKLFILEYLEAKFLDAAAEYNKNSNSKIEVKVYDPYNTSMDFFVLITTGNKHEKFAHTFEQYEEVHKLYRTQVRLPNTKFDEFITEWENFLKKINPLSPEPKEELFRKMKIKCFGGEEFPTLHASSSQTTLYFTARQVSEFYGVTGELKNGGKGHRVWEP